MSRLESVNAQLDAYKDLPEVSVHFTITTFALTCPGGVGLASTVSQLQSTDVSIHFIVFGPIILLIAISFPMYNYMYTCNGRGHMSHMGFTGPDDL